MSARRPGRAGPPAAGGPAVRGVLTWPVSQALLAGLALARLSAPEPCQPR